MIIEKEKLWEIDRATEISSAKREGKEIGIREGKEIGVREGKEIGVREGKEIGVREGMEIGEKKGAMSSFREMILGLFSMRYSNCQDQSELNRRLNLANTPEALKAIMQRLFALPLDAPYEEALKLI